MMEVDDLDAKHDTTMEVGPEPGADKDGAPAEPPRAAVPVDVETSSVADSDEMEMAVRAWHPADGCQCLTWAKVILVGAFLVVFVVFGPLDLHGIAQVALDKDFGTVGLRVGFGVFGVGWFLFLVAAVYALVGTLVALLRRCAFGKWQGIDDFLRRGNSHVWKIAGYISHAVAFVVWPLGMGGVWAGTWIYVQIGYFATEALGKGSEHVKGMYAVYALLSLGSVLGELLLVCTVVGLAFAMVSGYDCEAPSRGDLPDTIGKKVAYKLLNVLCVRLLFSTAMVFLVAGVVWAGTGICVAIGYFAAHAQGRGEGSFTGVYSLLTIGAVLGGLLYAWVVAGLIVAELSQRIYGDGRTRSEQPDSAANKAVDRDAVKSFFLHVLAMLFLSTAGAFLAAGVGWVGTEIYLVCSALV